MSLRVAIVGCGKAAENHAAEIRKRYDAELLAADLFCPGLRNIGSFEGGAMLAAPHPLLLHNINAQFSTTGISAAYKAAGAAGKFRSEPRVLSEKDQLKWILHVR